MNQKQQQSIYHANGNVDLMETKCNSDQWSNNDKYRCEYKICHACAKDYIWNPSTCSCENWKYLASITACSAVMCGQIIDVEPESNDKGKSSDEGTKFIPNYL